MVQWHSTIEHWKQQGMICLKRCWLWYFSRSWDTVKWAKFNSNSKNFPPCTEFHKFLDLHARHLESVSHTGHKQASRSDQKLLVKQSFTLSTDVTCLACKYQGNQIHTCSVFKGWILTDRISVVWELCLCMIFLRKGNITPKCWAPPMCKECTKHYMLLHRDADYLF